jgi:hypothetical protein
LRTTTYTNGHRERETDRHRDGSVLSKCHLAELNLKKKVSPDLSDLGTTRGEQDEHEARFFGAGKSRSDATRAVDRETDRSRYKTGTGAGLLAPSLSFLASVDWAVAAVIRVRDVRLVARPGL